MTVRSYRDVTVYRPFPGEAPVDIVGADAPLDDVRIAKLNGDAAERRIAGAYRLAPVEADRFEIVALAVYPAYRGVGIGRWLLGHALGIAESRGGRLVDAKGPAGFLVPAGFERHNCGFRIVLTPE